MAGAILGVERSLTGRRWRPRLDDDRAAMALAQRLDLPEALARVLAARGVSAEAADGFLDPRLKSLLPDPAVLTDMPGAVARLAEAIEGGEIVGIFGDYD
ncbi:MAG: single-stranded-DNA-specific exonuclease RecJ, partial [Rhodospirillaceae bacterium]|nr:single-stranded-DNA-specific exonuclease RecJ [Rhodospirillaceae bacterium]